MRDAIQTVYTNDEGVRTPLDKCSKSQTAAYINKLHEARYRAMMHNHQHSVYYINECLARAESRLEMFENGQLKETMKRKKPAIFDDDDDEDLTID